MGMIKEKFDEWLESELKMHPAHHPFVMVIDGEIRLDGSFTVEMLKKLVELHESSAYK